MRFSSLFLVSAFLVQGLVLHADDPAIVESSPAIITSDRNLGASTATGDALRSEGQLEALRGEGMYFRSLSAEHFQNALHREMDNRKESVEDYYELRELNKRERARLKPYHHHSASDSPEKVAAVIADHRLSDKQYDKKTGKIFWPKPLDSPKLAKFRSPIDKAFARRANTKEAYTKLDHYQVQRMVNLMKSAVESVKDKLVPGERGALDEYLDKIAFDSSFDRDNNRVESLGLTGAP